MSVCYNLIASKNIVTENANMRYRHQIFTFSSVPIFFVATSDLLVTGVGYGSYDKVSTANSVKYVTFE